MYDYAGLLREVIMKEPEIEEAVWTKPLEQLQAIGTEDTDIKQGGTIAYDIHTSSTTPVRAHTKADVDPIAGTYTTAKASWTKIYQDTAIEVHGIDISQSGGDGPSIRNLLRKALVAEMANLWAFVYDAIYAQWKLDLTTSGTYGSASALNRTTYPVLAVTNETTVTPMTPGLMTDHAHTVRLNKSTEPEEAYQWILESAVKKRLEPQVALMHTWNLEGKAGKKYDGGHQHLRTYGDTPVVSPQGMTTGDAFYGPRSSFMWQNHRPVEFRNVDAGRDAIKVVIEAGYTGYTRNIAKCGMQTGKQ